MEQNVKVDRHELKRVFATLSKLCKLKKDAEMVFSFEAGVLSIALPGGKMGVAADGEWVGRVRTPSTALRAIAKTLPPDNPMRICVYKDRLYFNMFAVPCRVDPPGDDAIMVPVNASLADILRLRHRYSDEQIERAGLTHVVENAERQKEVDITQAAQWLAGLDVSREDLCRLVGGCIDNEGRSK